MRHAVRIFSGAGNTFVVLDGRDGLHPDVAEIVRLCREYGTDGLMILSCPEVRVSCQNQEREEQKWLKMRTSSQKSARDAHPIDFAMEFYNPDGSGGMMCGNGGRCIVAFAETLGITPADGKVYHFLAPDGLHTAEILAGPGEPNAAHLPDRKWTVRLGMKSVDKVEAVKGGYFLNTGTRHFVKFVEDVDKVDILKDGPELRHDPVFAPEGTNVNFVQPMPDGSLKIRTFEKGVEGETLACGTGITASAIAYAHAASGKAPAAFKSVDAAGTRPDAASLAHTVRLHARIADLEVSFRVCPEGFENVYLTGPVEELEPALK